MSAPRRAARSSGGTLDGCRRDRGHALSGADPHLGALRLLVPTEVEGSDDDIDTLVVSTAVGVHAGEVVGQLVPVDDSTSGALFRSGKPVITESFRHPNPAFTDVGQRPAIVMPLCAKDNVVGVTAVARSASAPAFDPSYLDSVSDFASHAATALLLAAGRDRERELSILADRERIAHEPHRRCPRDRLRATSSRWAQRNPFCSVFVVAELTEGHDIAITLHTTGAMTAVGSELAEHAAAVMTQAISSSLRHSGASPLTVAIAAGETY